VIEVHLIYSKVDRQKCNSQYKKFADQLTVTMSVAFECYSVILKNRMYFMKRSCRNV